MDLVRKLILERLTDLDLKMSEASIKIGKNHAYLQQFLKRGIPAQLPEDVRGALAELLKVPEDRLRGTSDKLPKREYMKSNIENESLVADQTHAVIVPLNKHNVPGATPGSQLFGKRDLPVFGTAQGGEGAILLTNEAVDWVLRPDSLLRVKDGYGIIVTGDSMSPEHKSGSIALVNPHLPPHSGDSCIFRSHADDGAVRICIKELVRQTGDAWHVKQHTPPKSLTLKKSEWQICHVTVGNYFRR
jgi:phage repressor protein C with HTH and peptisase S24 domain